MKYLKQIISVAVLATQLPFASMAFAQDPVIKKYYTLVKKVHISRIEYDYTYKARIINGDIPIKNVSASVLSSSENTSIIDGNVAFDDILPGDTSLSSDTFTIRQNRNFRFDPASLIWSIKFDSAAPPGVLQSLQTLKQNVGNSIRVEWDSDGTNITSIVRPDWSVEQTEKAPSLSRPSELVGTPLENATAFLKNNHELFQLPADIADLRVESVDGQGISEYVISMEQTLNGIPVFDRGVAVIVEPYDNKYTLKGVIRVNNSYIPNLNISTTPTLSENEVIAIAQADAIATPLYRPHSSAPKPPLFVTRPKLYLGIYAAPYKEPILVYRFMLNITEGGLHALYIIDANSGEIISASDPAMYDGYVTGSGKVFDPNPVNTLNDTSLKDTDGNGVANSKNAVPIDPVTGIPYFLKDLREITYSAAPKQYFLRGPYVIIDDRIENPMFFKFYPYFGVTLNETRPDFKFTRENIAFEHVMAYYVIDTNQRYIQSLGLPKPINARPIKVDPHGFDDEDLSAYVPSKEPNLVGKGYLTFGRGGVDDAEDADIILHEYGHAIQDNQAPNLYMNAAYYGNTCYEEAGAMAEGFGDYWAASNTYEISLANNFSQGPECYGEWDHAGNPNKSVPHLDNKVDEFCRRRVDSPKVYPKDILLVDSYNSKGPCHENGEIWSSTLWDILLKLGKRTADQLVLESHNQIQDVLKKHKPKEVWRPSFSDGGLALLEADKVLLDKNVFSVSHKTEICATLKAKRILKTC